MLHKIAFTVNGVIVKYGIGDASHEISCMETLADTLRKRLGLIGTKVGCNHGGCGNCTVIINKEAVLACIMLTADCDGKDIITIEGLEDPVTGKLDPIQQAFVDHSAFQCGYCTPGIIMSIKALLLNKSNPTINEVKRALSGNYCRCISHYQVLEAVKSILAAETGSYEE